MLYWQKYKQIDLWKRTENTETNSFKYSQLRSNTGAKVKKKKKGMKIVLQQMVLELLNIHIQKVNLDSNITHFMKISSKWIIDLNAKCETTQLLEDNIGEYPDDLL